ncbi:MAG: transport permease protein [Candidatus Binatia bacterium]|nr:MAG: transport permease protein [Candidatus Binatia bacterium]
MNGSLSRISHIVWKEFIQLSRDRRMFVLVLLMPVIELFIFGYVVATDITNIALAVCDFDRSASSRDYVEHLIRSGYFRIAASCSSVREANRLLDRGQVKVVLTIPPDFSEKLRRGQEASVSALLDGTNSNIAMIASAYLEQITLTRAVHVRFPDRATGDRVVVHPRVEVEPRVWFNPELRSVRYMVPAIICVLLMESLVVLTAIAIVREKERGTMEQLIVTPVRAAELVLGKAIPFIAIGYVNMGAVMLAGRYWFGVELAGSLSLLLALSLLFIMTCLGMGLLVSTVSNTQQQASMLGQFVLLPNLFFSGFMFPIASMPTAIQYATHIIPLKYYITIVRGIFLKNAGWAELWDEASILLLFGVVILTAASMVFRKQVQ